MQTCPAKRASGMAHAPHCARGAVERSSSIDRQPHHGHKIPRLHDDRAVKVKLHKLIKLSNVPLFLNKGSVCFGIHPL